jgi:FkbM family methyltransferase
MTKSQEGQVDFVIKHLNGMRNGYFVDIGAYDGLEFSNTYTLEKDYGWTGLLVECDPAVSRALKHNRTSIVETRAVWKESNVDVEFKSIEGGKLSGISEKLAHKKAVSRSGKIYSLQTISLNDLFIHHQCPKHINYMSVDIEGAEYDVLSAFDFSHTFDVVSIEHIRDREKIIDLMTSKGYKAAKTILDGNETIFVREE